MKSFKGQAALEFMMTYGWAILVVLAAIGALSYFGILNPARFTPDTCLASSGFACPGKPIVNDTSIMFSIVNGLGYRVALPNLPNVADLSTTLSSCGGVYYCGQGAYDGCNNNSVTIEDGAGATLILHDCTFTNVNVIKGEIKIPFRNPQSMLEEMLIVSITGKSKTG
jgi:hypothetical protein